MEHRIIHPRRRRLSLLVFVVAFSFIGVSSGQVLQDEEVQTLKAISAKMNNRYWKDISSKSCSDGSLNITYVPITTLSSVACNCSLTTCHVTSIMLKGLNLSGVLPAEFGNLSHLQVIDVYGNFLDGTIPTTLSKIPLSTFSIVGNRISGTIPEVLGQISTLQEVIFEDNQLSGQLPESLGNLKNLKKLLLSANFFTGTIPEIFGNLKNLKEVMIDGNNFTGSIPDFIGNWTQLNVLNIQGAFAEGPIPPSLSLLTNLTELRISDLSISSSGFPNLEKMTNLQILILRNCLIIGNIPNYLGGMKNLKTLDLSFNQLTGQIPASLGNVTGTLVDLFLSNNLLSGEVPGWLQNSKQYFDVSYNNFTGSPSTTSCQNTFVNLASSFSSLDSNSIDWCLKKDLSCPGDANYYSLFINCGGGQMTNEGHEYLDDTSSGGPSYFSSPSNQWAFSSTGTFIYTDNGPFKAANTFNLSIDGPEYLQTARVSASSLRYYGLCLRKGSYTVKLHFAEIMYSNDTTFASLGNRVFDIYIQGTLKQKNFNIMKEAGGVGKGTTMNYTDISVNGSTLEIFLYWAGKGTTAIPERGVYGPLISAITVTPNFSVKSGLSVGVTVGIVIASCAVLASVLLFLRMKGRLGGKDDEDANEFRGFFSLRQIKAATNDFSPLNKISEDGYYTVYKGVLPDGKVIAVKQLKSETENQTFINEVGMITAVQHPNLVKLHGCCIQGKELLLVHEYMENNSLKRALFGHEDVRLNLDWTTRKKISLGIAKGLAYLHEESSMKIVHRDIKANNVLLDKDMNAKISGFGLAMYDEDENTHITTTVAGTFGYMAPEYASWGYLTPKVDVYSFGVVLLEIVSGKANTNYRPREEFDFLLDWAYVLQEQGNLLELVDPDLGTNYPKDEAMRFLNLSLLCTNPSPTLRPNMSWVARMIQGEIPVQAPKNENLLQDHLSTGISMSLPHSQVPRSLSTDGPIGNFSASVHSEDKPRQVHSSSFLTAHDDDVDETSSL